MQRELPAIQGEVIVMEARTGMRFGILDGAAVAARRTAALSLLAAQTLAPRPEGPLLIVGAGTQVRSRLEAFREGLGVSKVLLTSRTTERVVSLVKHGESQPLVSGREGYRHCASRPRSTRPRRTGRPVRLQDTGATTDKDMR